MNPDARNPSCLLYGPLDARFEDRPMPVLDNPHDVIVQVAYTGVCGSDVSTLFYYHVFDWRDISRTWGIVTYTHNRSTSGSTAESALTSQKPSP